MQLRPYQTEGHDNIYHAWANGHRNVLYCLPTGGGKTVTFAHIVKEEPNPSAVLAHRGELVAQTSLALAREGVRHSIIGPKSLIKLCTKSHLQELHRSYYDPNALTLVGSVQSIGGYKGNFDYIKLWVHDEAHHLLKENQFGRAVARFPNARGLGVTATPGRADGRGLGRNADGVFDVIVMGPSPADLINQGYLCQYKIFAPPSTLDLSNVHITPSGDFSPQELKVATKQSTVLGDVVEHYSKYALGKSGLTFADSIDNAVEIAANFRASGIHAEVLSGKTPAELRANVLHQFKHKEILQIVSVALIDEGFDCPGIEVVSDAAATESFNRFAQRFGRGLRIMDNKPYMIYLDHVGNTLRHGLPDALRQWSLARRDKKAKSQPDGIPLTVCLNVECIQPYPRIYKSCPYCGNIPPILNRRSPEYVDGDLLELDAETLAILRGAIDPPLKLPYGATPAIEGALKKHYRAKQAAQTILRNNIAHWAGWYKGKGETDSMRYRRFYLTFGVDVARAQALGIKDAEELTTKIKEDLLCQSL